MNRYEYANGNRCQQNVNKESMGIANVSRYKLDDKFGRNIVAYERYSTLCLKILHKCQ